MKLRIASLVATVGIIGFCFLIGPQGRSAAVPPDLLKFRDQRSQIAHALAEPIATCIQKQDTDRPAFHGCVDWHSATHAAWALTAFALTTGDQRYRPILDKILQPAALEQERKYLAEHPGFEMPYGRAWFLRLAIDHHRGFGSDLLIPFADDVADSLLVRFRDAPTDPLSLAYDSATWALINLHDYGVARDNKRIVDFVRDKVRAHYLKNGPCPIQSAEVDPGEFMAICTNWAWLVGKIIPHDEFVTWLGEFLPEKLRLAPITSPNGIHQAGLNFSRAWGLWNLYWMTDDPRFLRSYLDHIEATYANPALWKGGYYTVAHWVPQFGMLAIVVSYYDWP